MPTVSTTKMTARQFHELGEDPVGVFLELVDGGVAVSPSATPQHSYFDTQLRTLINAHIKANHLGELFGDVDTVFGEYDVRRPDLLFFATKRLHLIGQKAIEGPPDLCVEITSPSSTKIDRVDKFKQYEAGGVAYYWVADPIGREFEGYKLRRGRYVLTGQGRDSDVLRLPPFPGLDIPLADLWLPDFRKGCGRKAR